MRTRLKRPAALPACRWFSASVPAYGRSATFFHSQTHFVADLRPVFAPSWLTRSFRRCSTPAACASMPLRCHYRQLLHALSLVHRPAAEDHQFRQGVGAQTVCTVQPTEEHSPTANRPLMRVSQFCRFRYRPWCSVRSDVPESVLYRIDANVRFRQFADERQTFMSFFSPR